MPSNIVELINLHKLNLAHNKISYIDKDAFRSLSLLMDLDLSNNQIQKLHPRTFTGMEKMRKLILSGNLLSRMEAYQFPVLPNLERLHINNCRLTYINSQAFANLKKLKSVSLKGNKLKILEPDLFISRPELKSVELGDNLWVCDCKLKRLIHWIQREKIGEAEISCHSPERMAGKLWLDINERELACAPEIFVPQTEVPINLGGNATLSCGAKGEPLPQMRWVLDGRLLTNMTELTIPYSESEPNVKFILHEELEDDGLLWTNLSVIQIGEDFMLHGYDQSSPFKCKVENEAKIVEKNVTLVIGMVVESPVTKGNNLEIYAIIAIIAAVVIVVVFIIFICICCWKKQNRQEAPPAKASSNDKAFMERNNILIVNPVEKPPRKNEIYEKLPQADIELTDLTKGSHKSFEEMNYPEERVGRIRSPLTPLEEEEFDQSSQKLLNESLNTTATVDYVMQYPDLLDTVKFPRAVSPTQLSYHSLVNPLYSPNPEWRYSYVYPSEYIPAGRFTPNLQQPQYHQRPGYVTLPRRPRTSSVTSMPPSTHLSPTRKFDPIYDTLGPRTTADGTSRTDLTRPMSRSMLDPYNPVTPISPTSPPSLPLHYVPISVENENVPISSSRCSTLPKSTPNLLEDKGLSVSNLPSGIRSQPSSSVASAPSNNYSSLKDKYVKSLTRTDTKSPVPSGPPLRIKPTLKSSINNNNINNNNNNNNSNNNNNGSNNDSTSNGKDSTVFTDANNSTVKKVMPNGLITNSTSSDDNERTSSLPVTSAKKVPPKPPPKPSVKRLSVASTGSDVTSKISSQGGSALGINYQDEGPDGTEV
ncbi:Leucine-rich repeat-containing protein 24 [Armadillidium vulgare]|nr:Leucine-rich repeat-containing protein 24 [Armadillidium vulgare]